MFGNPPAGAGGAGGNLFGGLPMPTPEQMQNVLGMMGGAGGAGGAGAGGLFGAPPAVAADSRPAHERYAVRLLFKARSQEEY